MFPLLPFVPEPVLELITDPIKPSILFAPSTRILSELTIMLPARLISKLEKLTVRICAASKTCMLLASISILLKSMFP